MTDSALIVNGATMRKPQHILPCLILAGVCQHAGRQSRGMHRSGAAPLLHGSVLVVAGDPLAGWPSQAGLLLQSSILFVVQLLQLGSPSLLAHLCHVKDSFRR